MKRRAALYFALAASMVPLLALIPLGAVWLWQQGWLVVWLLSAAVLGAAAYGLTWWLGRMGDPVPVSDDGPITGPNPDFSPLDQAAWGSVEALAKEVSPDIIFDYGELLQTARLAIEAVSSHYHPHTKHPMWHFTLPELLLLSERVSQRLRRVLLEEVPGSHLVRAGDVVRLWEFKPLATRGAKVFKGLTLVWRVTRLVNPMSALLAEARERLVGAALGDAGTWIKQRGSRLWVEEVGRAAIELYSGRLGLDAASLAAADRAPAGIRQALPPGPVRVVVAGQINAGKSSLINALLSTRAAGVDVLPHTAAFEAHELAVDGEVQAILTDSPGLASAEHIKTISDLAWDADALLWVVAGHRADRALDRKALDAIRARFAAEPKRSQPPIRIVVTHLDRLSPAREWSPPYDLNHPTSAKAEAMRAAVAAIAEDLLVPPERLLPVRLQDGALSYNVDLLWPAILEDLEAAQRARMLRLALHAQPGRWRQLLKQARAAGKTLWQEAG